MREQERWKAGKQIKIPKRRGKGAGPSVYFACAAKK